VDGKAGFLRILHASAGLGWIAMASAVGACGPSDPAFGTAESAIYGGTRDDASNDAVVALRVGDAQNYRLCTGALIAPNVVVTARHCTSIAATETIGCNAEGQSTNGNHFLGDVAPADIHVFAGVTPIMTGTPRANGRQVFRPDSIALCNSDIALVVLDRTIDGISPRRVRLSGGVAVGETILSVGYGENDQSYTSGVRHVKDALVLAIGAGVMKDGTVLGSGEFEIGRATCQGDSGGPGISAQTGAIVGIASRGVGCSQDYGHVYMRTAAMRTLFDKAFAFAGGSAIEEEGGPSPPNDAGAQPTPNGYKPPIARGCSARIAPDLPSDDSVIAVGSILLLLGVRRRSREPPI
jgi:hypothetical protein